MVAFGAHRSLANAPRRGERCGFAMKILLVTPCATHPTEAGNSRRIANLINALARLGHDTHILYLPHFMLGLPDPTQMIRHWKERLHVGRPHWGFVPGSLRIRLLWMREQARDAFETRYAAETTAPRFDRLIRPDWEELARRLHETFRFDAVIVEYILLSRILLGFPDSVHKIIDTLDLFADRHDRIQKVPKRFRWFSTTRDEEVIALRRAHVVVAIEGGEADYFRRVEVDRVVTIGHLVERVTTAREPPGPPAVVIIGSGNPNNRFGVSVFLQRVWPRVRERVPDARLRLIGRICDTVAADHPGVERLGVIDDTAAAYEQGHVVVNPVLEGTGLPIKSIEALMHGKALVATPWAARSLHDARGTALLETDTPEAMADDVIRLLRDAEVRRNLSTAALRYAEGYAERQTRNLQLALTKASF
jgi:glycosyltransferase involved in cell wall biosynthesis